MRDAEYEETERRSLTWLAGIIGRSKEMCPYQMIKAKSQWLGGR